MQRAQRAQEEEFYTSSMLCKTCGATPGDTTPPLFTGNSSPLRARPRSAARCAAGHAARSRPPNPTDTMASLPHTTGKRATVAFTGLMEEEGTVNMGGKRRNCRNERTLTARSRTVPPVRSPSPHFSTQQPNHHHHTHLISQSSVLPSSRARAPSRGRAPRAYLYIGHRTDKGREGRGTA